MTSIILPDFSLLCANLVSETTTSLRLVTFSVYVSCAYAKAVASVNTLNPEDYPNFGKSSMGGALFLNRQVFIDSGMENEYFISWGAEDWERFRRFVKLGYRVGRVKGPLFHIDHARKQDSNENNPYYQRNVAEYQKVDTLSVEQLKEYIKTWPWLSL